MVVLETMMDFYLLPGFVPVLFLSCLFSLRHTVIQFSPNSSYLEKDLKTKCVVEMEENQTILHPATTSMNKGDPR